MGDLAQLFVCLVVTWERERYPSQPSFLATYGRQEIWLWHHDSKRDVPDPQLGPAPCLGSMWRWHGWWGLLVSCPEGVRMGKLVG